MEQHDVSYRDFFSDRHKIRDLLREVVSEEQWVDLLDFDSGVREMTAFFKGFNSKRDLLWKFRRKNGGDPIYLFIFLERQERPDPAIPIRLMARLADLYQALRVPWKEELPSVIPIVVNTSGKRGDVATDIGSLIRDLDPSVESYRPQVRYYLVEGAEVDRRIGRTQEEAPFMDDLAEIESAMTENIHSWSCELVEKGRQEGEARLVLRLLQLKFAPLGRELEDRVYAANRDRLFIWGQRVLRAATLQDVFRDSGAKVPAGPDQGSFSL